jgi:hypothetical protein
MFEVFTVAISEVSLKLFRQTTDAEDFRREIPWSAQ